VKRHYFSILPAALCVLLQAPASAGVPAVADREIQYLLEFVATSGCDFVRNGSSHDPVAAAEHLRLKYRRGSRYVNSAEQFIDRLASESSWTGRAYTATCDEQVIATSVWLHQALDNYRRKREKSTATQ
jgi:hypothetical protein